MPRFRQDNTEGYSDADLIEMNVAYDQITAGMTLYPDDFDKSLADHIAEEVKFKFDQGLRGDDLIRDERIGA